MGNYLSTSQPTSDEAAVSSKEELKHLAKVKRAEDARKEAIAANVHDNNKVGYGLIGLFCYHKQPWWFRRANTLYSLE